jgi:hypothetical protein
VVIEKAMTQLVSDQANEHAPGYLIAAPLPHHIALLDLDHVRVLGIYPRDTGAEQNAIAPVLDSRNQ